MIEEEQPNHKYWEKKIGNSLESAKYKAYMSRCKSITAEYRSEDDDNLLNKKPSRKFNVLWSNLQTLRPATFTQLPKVTVKRRHDDDDQLANSASEILSRALDYELETNNAINVFKRVRDDFLLYARGVSWVRYEMIKGDEETVIATDEINNSPNYDNHYECVKVDYVAYNDFLHSDAERWEDVEWVARRVYLTKKQAEQRFGEEVMQDNETFSAINWNEKNDTTKHVGQIEVWEIWSKPHKKVYWWCERAAKILDEQEPPYNLDNFFPCAEPVYGTITNNTTIPVPDFIYIQDESRDIDDMMSRVAALCDALKTRGVYDAEFDTLRNLFNQNDNAMVPVKDFSAFVSKGGFDGAVKFMPTAEIVSTIKSLIEMITYKTQIIYEKTGIADIMRGASEVNETATAQNIKNRFASMRLEDKRTSFANHLRDTISIMGQVISALFKSENLMYSAGVRLQPAPQIGMVRDVLVFPNMYADDFERCVILLRNKLLRAYKIDIETDSTVAVDEAKQQSQVNEMLATLGGFMQQGVAIGQQVPEMVPVMAEAIKMLARSYRAAKTLEPLIDKAMEELKAKAVTPPPPQETALEVAKMDQTRKAMKDKADIAIKTEQLRLEQQKSNADIMLKQAQYAQKQQEIALEAQQENRLAAKEVIDAQKNISLV